MLLAIGVYVLALGLTKWKLPGRDMVGRRKNAVAVAGAAIVIFALLGGAWTQIFGEQAAPAPEPTPQPGEVPTGCPSTGFTNVTIDVTNHINTATSEGFDEGIRCVADDGTGAFSITDTTSSPGANAVCGKPYTCYITSTAGAAGDGSTVQVIKSGPGTISDGNLKFTASGPAMSFQLGVDQLGVTEARLWDVKNAGWVYDNASATASDYKTDGTWWESTTNNSTTMAVGSGGEVHVQMSFRATAIDNALNDGRGLLFAVDADVTKWDTPTIMLDGSVMSDCKGSLNPNEALALNGYEHVYCYSGSKTFAQNSEGVLDFQVFALAGVNPGATDDIQIDIIPRGQKATLLDANKFIQSAYDDTASHAVILQVDDFGIDIS